MEETILCSGAGVNLMQSHLKQFCVYFNTLVKSLESNTLNVNSNLFLKFHFFTGVILACYVIMTGVTLHTVTGVAVHVCDV